MPSALTYPGVYIEEIPSGVRTITGVATSITAFLGRATRGPTNEPITINSYGDFERQFGGLDVDYPLGYAVRDFFGNGDDAQAASARRGHEANHSRHLALRRAGATEDLLAAGVARAEAQAGAAAAAQRD